DIDENMPSSGERCGSEVRLFRSDSAPPTALEARLSELQGRGDVKVLKVDQSSSLEDLRLLHLFPALEQVRVFGRKVGTLNGVERLSHVRDLVLGRGTAGKPVDLRALGGATVEALELHRCTPEQLAVVSQATRLKSLSILQGE